MNKQEYMDKLFGAILNLSKNRENDAVVLPALISNYESKINQGWPYARTHVG